MANSELDLSLFVAATDGSAITATGLHRLSGNSFYPSFPAGTEYALFAMGCFWGAERRFWQRSGVYVTAVGYAGGHTRNPSYEEVCSGLTGHTEAVLVVFDPADVGFADFLEIFWQSHDPTQGMRQGNDLGSQYRSAIYCMNAQQLVEAKASCEHYQQRLTAAGRAEITTEITTEIALQPVFYYAEGVHQQYLIQNPNGYCGLRGTGVLY